MALYSATIHNIFSPVDEVRVWLEHGYILLEYIVGSTMSPPATYVLLRSTVQFVSC